MPVNKPLSDRQLAVIRGDAEHGIGVMHTDALSLLATIDELRAALAAQPDTAGLLAENRTLVAAVESMNRKLRAVLAARPQPLFEGTIISRPDRAFIPRVMIRLDEHVDVALGKRVVVYPAVAGSATPGDSCDSMNESGMWCVLPDGHDGPHDWAAAGSATPTQEDET